MPYFVFAGFAALLGGLDIKVLAQGGLLGSGRIARHLWRMCFALFFAAAFFFLGQQKVMPLALRGSPVLTILAFAPLALMVFLAVSGSVDQGAQTRSRLQRLVGVGCV